jgi:hypothetical protein
MVRNGIRGVVFFAITALTTVALAATPPSGTLTAPAAGQTASITWAGGPFTGATADPTACTTLTCDTYQLTVNVPATFYSSNPNYAVHVRADWSSSSNDFDLNVLDGAGNVVCSSGQGGTIFEDADCGALASGVYTVQVVGFTVVNATYNGSASLGPEPTSAVGRARYKPGNFTFSTPLVLPGPPNTLTGQQGIEPRVAVDPVGNMYAAAIQGVPAGTDAWKSMDAGKTWKYLGQPDGAQAAAVSIGRGEGLGGGDEDIAIGASGNVYITSLWLGSATQSKSTDGGNTWIVNPLSTDVPGTDREWLAAQGNNVVYLTYKQLGVALSGTESIFVAKSFDGGITFPQIVEATTPQFGVQPGDQGNIVVDPASGYVYTSFIGQNDLTKLYQARSTDGGLSWTIKQVYSAASGSLVNIFPITALDRAGNVYISFSDGHNIFLTASTDHGATWTTPVRVSNGAGTKTSLSAWIEAGDAGKVNVMWWGTSAASNMDTAANWQVFMAQTQNALANVPTFTQSALSPVMHTGAICTNGTGCASGTRNLAEYFAHTTYLDGNAVVVYPDDKNNASPMTTFVRQTGGSKIIGR